MTDAKKYVTFIFIISIFVSWGILNQYNTTESLAASNSNQSNLETTDNPTPSTEQIGQSVAHSFRGLIQISHKY